MLILNANRVGYVVIPDQRRPDIVCTDLGIAVKPGSVIHIAIAAGRVGNGLGRLVDWEIIKFVEHYRWPFCAAEKDFQILIIQNESVRSARAADKIRARPWRHMLGYDGRVVIVTGAGNGKRLPKLRVLSVENSVG